MIRSKLIAAALAACALTLTPPAAFAGEKSDFRVCWTIYAGWMPWDYAAASGIVDKWAAKYDINIEVVQINDYIESINQYTAGAFDGCTMTNMDALTIPAAGGVDSTALIIGDFSNGNDGIVIKGEDRSVADLKGMSVNLVELSVSHYLLARALESVGLSERDLRVINTSDADLVAAFATPSVQAVVTWNPLLAEVAAFPGVSKVFDSSQIPGEILDLMVVNTDTLAANPAFGKALVGAWYEVMAIMRSDGAEGRAAREHMAAASGTDLAGYEAQLDATHMFYQPAEALAFALSPDLPETMRKVAAFSFEHGLLGDGARDAEAIGMQFANDVVVGNPDYIRLRFDPSFMQWASEGMVD